MSSLVILSACANLNTIDRWTSLPTSKDSSGRAVHLDIQQRLLLVNEFGRYCSEPSPDALAAYAAAIGVGSSDPTSATSAAASGQSSAASIGLRTQSITLMRDALFRMCEAFANDAVGPAQIAALLSRSQDLTAVILAVEQLTGAVAANQTTLVSSTGADAAVSLLASSELLDAAIKNEERAQKALEQAAKELSSAETERNAADHALTEARATRDGLPETTTDEARREAIADVQFRQAERERTQRAVDAAQSRVDIRQRAYDNFQRTRETIATKQDQAFAGASTVTGGNARFSEPVQRTELDKDATEAIASSVNSMVTEVLRKNYEVESCMAIITLVPLKYDTWSTERKTEFGLTRRFCMDLVNQTAIARITETTTTFGADETSDRIDAWLDADDGNRDKLMSWLSDRELSISLFRLLQGDFGYLREDVIEQLSIPKIPGTGEEGPGTGEENPRAGEEDPGAGEENPGANE